MSDRYACPPASRHRASVQVSDVTGQTIVVAERRFLKSASLSNGNGADGRDDRASTERLIVTNLRAEQAPLAIGIGE